jgi:uncharacterized protein YndB with AHSA1/START domain
MRIIQHIDIEASATAVWEVIGPGFADIGSWASAIPHSAATADGRGRVCTVSGVPGIDQVVEQIIANDHDARTLTYLAQGMPAFVTEARNQWRIEPLGPQRTRATFVADVDVKGLARLATPLLWLGLRALGRRTLRELRHVVEHGQPNARKRRQIARSSGSAAGRTPTAATDQGRLLADAISVNLVFSAASGAVLAAGAVVLDTWLGVDARILTAVGSSLVAFAGFLAWLLIEPNRLRWGARVVVGADAAWVAATMGLLVGWPSALTPAGRTMLIGLAAVVAAIGATQLFGLHRAGPGQLVGTSPVALRFERVLPVPAGQVWEAVSDAGGYARYAPGIAETRVVSGQGQGMVRVCTDDRGGRWAERCTLWDEGTSYRMTVDVETYPAYYRVLLHEFAQTWTVEPTPGGTRLTLTFEGAVKLGILGRIAIRWLGASRRLEAILERYERDLLMTSRVP